MTTATTSAAAVHRRIRVLLADDEPSFRDALADIIIDEPSFDLVALAADSGQAVELAARQQPDVAVVDVRMPGGGGPEAARGIRIASPATAVLALSASDDRGSVFRMLQAGAMGYMVKGATGAALIDGIRRAVDHEPTLSMQATAHVLHKLSADLHREEETARVHQESAARVQQILEGSDRLHLVFQPIVDLHLRRTVGYEALARFADSPARGPDEWFAEADSVGLRTELELRAIELALDALQQIPDEAYLAVNASPQTIATPGLLDLLARVPPRRVVIEVTEHAAIGDYDAFARHVERLRAAGARLAVDDAGAGFSSFHHVLRLAPEIIKIDREITRGVHRDRRFTALAAALAAFAEQTDAALVAEGVETDDQLRALHRLGVSHAQGYLLGRPGDLPAEQAAEQQPATYTTPSTTAP